MSEPFDYGDPKGLELELDLPSAPPARRAAKGWAAPPDADALFELPAESTELPEELTAPSESASAPPETEAWSLELEDVAPPAAPTAHASPARAAATHAAPPARLAQPAAAALAHAPPARTVELRVAQAVDRMSPLVRGGLLALTMVGMLLLGTSVLTAGVRSAIHTVETLRLQGERAHSSPR